MPWVARKGHGCPDSKPWAVLVKGTDERVGCHRTRRAALAQIAALNANVDEALYRATVDVEEAAQRFRKVRTLKPLERRLERFWRASFRREARVFIAGLRRFAAEFPKEERGRGVREADGGDLDGVHERAAAAEEALRRETLLEIQATAIASGGQSLLADLEMSGTFDLTNPRAVDWLRRSGLEEIAGINESTRAGLRRILAKALDGGWSYVRTEKAMRLKYRAFSAARAHAIAVTETASAYEQGNRIMAGDVAATGIVLEKSWITVGDDRVDEDACGPNEDEGWIAFEDTFQSGDTEPPAHTLCRCTAGYRQRPEEPA